MSSSPTPEQLAIVAHKNLLAAKRNQIETEMLDDIAVAVDAKNHTAVRQLTKRYKKWINNGRPLILKQK